ncbi:hypothetical protein AADZ91_16665 [Colwelliaceae bacterium 6441]
MTHKFLIDTHCHFFSAQHIPLTQTIQRIQNKVLGSTFKKVKTSIAATVASPIFFSLMADDTIDQAIPFIKFFDTDAAFSINKASNSMNDIEEIDVSDRIRIFTPLIMDFEVSIDYKPLKKQANDLYKNITSINDELESLQTLVLPFLGFDLRRLHGSPNITEKLDEIISANIAPEEITTIGRINLADFDNMADNFSQLNGRTIGIKLYPSIGCDIWPEGAGNSTVRTAYLELMSVFAQRKYPITVHCQTDSYEGGDLKQSDDELINFAHPEKWWNMLQAAGDSVTDIRLNLAHFGGENGLKELFRWKSIKTPGSNIIRHKDFKRFDADDESWTYWILKLIKTYPNVYSDISAFDFKGDEKACASFLWILHLDGEGELDDEFGNYRLIDKLMWGSDIPMTLFGYADYKEQFDTFIRKTKIEDDYLGKYQLPPHIGSSLNHELLIEKLIDTNPKKFLFTFE